VIPGTNAKANELRHPDRGGAPQDTATVDMFPRPAPKSLEPDERYTTRETMAWCASKAGVAMWDLDVAACEESHKADVFYSVETDGLAHPWFGRVWCNPPFSDIGPWVEKAWREMASSPGPTVIAMLIPASRTEQPWWQGHVERSRDGFMDEIWPQLPARLTTHFLPGRTRFGHPGNPEGVGVGSPPFGCVLLVWRKS